MRVEQGAVPTSQSLGGKEVAVRQRQQPQDDKWPWALAVGFALGALTIIAIVWLQNNVVARWPL